MKSANPQNEPSELQLATREAGAVVRHQPTTYDLLEAAIKGGVTHENVAVVERLVQLKRDEDAETAKKAFAAAFFKLRRKISTLDIYADKSAKNDSGTVCYTYCSEAELSKALEPLLFEFGFATLFGQKADADRITVELTLIHEGGHSETRCYSVRPGAANRMKDATAVDAGAATTALRHLAIKLFGLKSRIKENDDPRNIGEQITEAQAVELQRRVMETESNEIAFLKLAGVTGVAGKPTLREYQSIMSGKYEMLDDQLKRKEQRGR